MTWWARYVGTPYAEAHCWALVCRVYRDCLNVNLPEYGEVDARHLVAVARAMAEAQAADRWQVVTEPQAYDVALMRGRSQVWHVGVMTDPAHVLHTERQTDAVRVRIDDLAMRGRITGFRRLAPNAA